MSFTIKGSVIPKGIIKASSKFGLANVAALTLKAFSSESYSSGTEWRDLSSNGNHATISGTFSKVKNFLRFPGSSTASIPSSPSLEISEQITLTAWLRTHW